MNSSISEQPERPDVWAQFMMPFLSLHFAGEHKYFSKLEITKYFSH